MTLLCGECQVPAETVTNEDGEAEALCPYCGQRDKMVQAHQIATEHLGHKASVALQDALQRVMKGNEYVKLETKALPKRRFRWHAKDDPDEMLH